MTGKAYDWSNKNLRVVEWVKCSERMPEENSLVLVHMIGFAPRVAYLKEGIWIVLLSGECQKPESGDWWMELPEGPR